MNAKQYFSTEVLFIFIRNLKKEIAQAITALNLVDQSDNIISDFNKPNKS
tara:strand:+ start:790 stop:939 length:150 start_codon:yes stop_codon:yes gene_type:complete